MDPTTLNPWIVLTAGVLGIGGTVWTIFSKPGAKAQADVAKLGEKVEAVEERVAVLEAEMQHLPDRETTHAMELAFRDLKGEVAVLVERIGPIAKTSERLQEFLLSQGR